MDATAQRRLISSDTEAIDEMICFLSVARRRDTAAQRYAMLWTCFAGPENGSLLAVVVVGVSVGSVGFGASVVDQAQASANLFPDGLHD